MQTKPRYSSWNKFDLAYLKKARAYLIINVVRSWMTPPQLRVLLLKLIDVRFTNPKSVFIGADVTFDHVKNGRVFIGNNVTITTGVKIMNHYIEPTIEKQTYSEGDVYIGNDVFIGMNCLIVKPVKIGNGSLIAAGSVITSDVPEYAIFGGVPGKVLGVIRT